jgi:hypothetical protein
MDHVKIATFENGRLVHKTRGGFQSKKKRNPSGATFMNSSMPSVDGPDSATQSSEYKYEMVFLQHGQRPPRARISKNERFSLSAKPVPITSREAKHDDSTENQQFKDRKWEQLVMSDFSEMYSPVFVDRVRQLAKWQAQQLQNMAVVSNYQLPFYVQNDGQGYFLKCLAVSRHAYPSSCGFTLFRCSIFESGSRGLAELPVSLRALIIYSGHRTLVTPSTGTARLHSTLLKRPK